MNTLEKNITQLNIQNIRQDFPILHQKVNGYDLVYFDNAATSQKPKQVIKAVTDYYEQYNSNIHRGAHYLANYATEQYENARKKIATFINANAEREVNFVRGTTEGINLVANSYAKKFLRAGDEILISGMEHHSNIVPWQMVCEATGAILKVIPVLPNGELDMEGFDKLLSEKTKLVSVVYISNSLGTINPVEEIITKAHAVGAKVMLDGAQAAPHYKVDVQKLDCDFLAFSGHKMYAPTGIGVLWGKENLLESMNPYMGGGEMIKEVRFEKTTYNDLPYKFEAGTPHIEGGIGLGSAIDYINSIGIENIAAAEHVLLEYGNEKLSQINNIRFVGTAKNKASVISFLLGNAHPYDVGVLLDKMGIAIRTGHHCCMPLMERFEIEGTCRASFSFYNTKEEIDRLAEALVKANIMLN
jgi:cysteine desulfurase / selenocysteine lyase